MTSCLFTSKQKKILAIMFAKKERLQKEFALDPTKEQVYLLQRNLITEYIMRCMGPALEARIRTWVSRKYCEEDVARSLVYEHVLITVDKYCPSRGNCSVSSFLWTISNRAFANHINTAKRQKRDPRTAQLARGEDEESLVSIDLEVTNQVKERFLVSLDEPTSSLDDSSYRLTLADVVPDPARIDEALTFELLLKTIHKHCSEQQKAIVSLLQQNFTYKEIADQLGCTAGIVSRQIQQLRKKLQHEIKSIRTTTKVQR